MKKEEILMKNTKLIIVFAVVCAIAFTATGCAAKKVVVAPVTAPVATPIVDLATVVDAASFTAAYDSVIAQYTDVNAKIVAGDSTLATKAADLVTLAGGLDTAAGTIKASLKDAALTDFTTKADAYKAQFAALVPAAPAAAATTATK